MTTVLSPLPKQFFLTNAGLQASGYKVFTYTAGTTTKLATYTDSSGGTPNTNPIILNSRGEADIWLSTATAYKFVFSPPTDTDPPTNPIWTVDNINTPAGTAGFTEQSVATNQSVSAGNSGTNYVATSAVTITIAKTTTLSTTWQITVFAEAGAITITPNAADQINGGTAGASIIIPQGASATVSTDANGNLYIAVVRGPTSSPSWIAAGGTADAITGTYQPTVTTLFDGLILAFRSTSANATTTPTFKADGTTAHTITKNGFIPLLPGDIPGASYESFVRYNLANTSWVLLNPSNPVRAYLSGLTLSTAGSSTTMTVAAGSATDSTNAIVMPLAASIGKTTGAWAVGTGNGGLDTGTIANSTWYHFYLIMRPDTGVSDVLFSLSASAPTMPTNYSFKRRIGSGLTDGSGNWTAFTQVGDYFTWSTSVGDVAATNPGNSAVLATLTVPTGIKVNVLGLINIIDTAGVGFGILITDPASTDETATTSLCTIQNQVTNVRVSSQYQEYTNTSAQIRYRAFGSGASSSFIIRTQGWIDRRGRDS